MSLTPVDVAQRQILQRISPLEEEEATVDEALGRCTARAVAAIRTLPVADNSAMDGYAVRAADLGTVPARLTVVERIFAGQVSTRKLEAHQCARIMTGAALPAGADAVVMQEKTREGDGSVEILEAVRAGANVRYRGEDTAEGQTLLPMGTGVGVAELAVLWGQGITHVPVRRRPRVAIVSSGDELVEVGGPHGGQLYDTNSPTLAALARRCGAVVRQLGIAPDRLEAVRQKIETGLSPDFDVLICVAGMSVGERDYVREVLGMLGVQLELWRVAMRPGKPLAFGTRGSTAVFGLPGNPISAMVTFELFVRPALRKLQGLSSEVPTVPGVLTAPLRKPAGLRLYARAAARYEQGQLLATPVSSQSSGALTSAVGATHLAVLPESVETAAAGHKVDLIPVGWTA